MRRFYVPKEQIDGSRAFLSGGEAAHLRSVLRLKPGDVVLLVDGDGGQYEASVESVDPERVVLRITGRRAASGEAPVEIVVAQALLKESKMDNLVRQLTELGMGRWVPFAARRSVPRPSAVRQVARVRRWRKIAVAALKQCRRTRLPRIDATRDLVDVLTLGADCDLKVMFWEREARALSSSPLRVGSGGPKTILALFGPEGGFAEDEVEAALEAGFITASLGPRTLRAETAALAGCVLLQYLYGDMGQNGLDIQKEVY
jgi:16S rRNA (uracil1498-N3)-methyltransferase